MFWANVICPYKIDKKYVQNLQQRQSYSNGILTSGRKQRANYQFRPVFRCGNRRRTLPFDEQNQETRLPMVRTENVWHLAVTGVKTGTEYAFRIHGEFANPQKLILDPMRKP